ncbi:fungal specific transcription factor domain-containing protein, partial [Diplocarpon mali]
AEPAAHFVFQRHNPILSKNFHTDSITLAWPCTTHTEKKSDDNKLPRIDNSGIRAKSGIDCMFLAPALDQASQLKLTEIKEKVGSLEKLLERDVAKTSQKTSILPTQDRALPDDADDYLSANEDEKNLEVTPLAVVDAAYDFDGDDDDILDLGIQLGKMRITERIGGFFRPKIAEELEYTMSNTLMVGGKHIDDGKLASKTQPVMTCSPAAEWLKPGPAYILPTSGFFVGGTGPHASLIDFLPSRMAGDRLIRQYFECVHPICQIVHRPTFEKEWDTFWGEVTLGIEPPSSVQTIVFAAMFSGVASLTENFKLGIETALARANFLRTTKIEILQAFVMYLIPLCRAEMSRAHSVLLGAAIRMAECMGIHRDGLNYGMNPLETHVRRLVWHQLCFLDIRTCEAQGPRPTIRRDEFDTKLPLNANDIDIRPDGKAPVGLDMWTDATFSLIRFEINEMIRTIWIDRPRIERRKISLTAVLSKIETFRRNMAAKYDHLIDDRVPLQRCAKLVKALLMSRLQIMVLHRYHNSVVAPMPDRLRNILLSAGTVTLETAVTLETRPELRPWSWYGGAYQQYHIAFLLLMEVYIYPQRKEAERIWNCLDYIFETDTTETRREKGKRILQELQRKTAVYQSMRGMRAPVTMDKHIGQREALISENNHPRDLKPTGFEQNPYHPQQQQQIIPMPLPYDPTMPFNQVMQEQPASTPTPAPSFGVAPGVSRVPVFSGVSNGESLWAFPSTHSQSPEASSDSASLPGYGQGQMAASAGKSQEAEDDLMDDIDWDAFDALFPPEQQVESESMGFSFPGDLGGC